MPRYLRTCIRGSVNFHSKRVFMYIFYIPIHKCQIMNYGNHCKPVFFKIDTGVRQGKNSSHVLFCPFSKCFAYIIHIAYVSFNGRKMHALTYRRHLPGHNHRTVMFLSRSIRPFCSMSLYRLLICEYVCMCACLCMCGVFLSIA